MKQKGIPVIHGGEDVKHSRCIRRHHRMRLKKSRRFHWGRDLINEPKYLSKATRTPTPCSCVGCCNWRKTEGPTISEIRNNDLFEFEIAHYAD